MNTVQKLTTKGKALALNLNENIYGTLAEIGAGQEVAANFFRAGGASGTIAKTMSAYDMNFSDAIYGQTERYVCEEKLLKMLEKEYNLLSERLQERAKKTNFFAFSNTIEAINYKKTNIGHGWIGLRFQLHPNSKPNNCILHIVLKDNNTQWQQEVLGKIGVNLIHGCYNYFNNPQELLDSLTDNFSKDRIEIDMLRLEGPDFRHVNNKIISLKLVKSGLTQAAMFDQKGKVMQPSEALYKKNIIVLRGRFRPVTLVNIDMMISGLKQFLKDKEVDRKKLSILTELTLNDLREDNNEEIDEIDFLDRADLLGSLGQTVLISNYQQHYKLASYLAQFTRKKKIAIILGINNLKHIFDESYYTNLDGGILESFGRLFGNNVKLLVYPSLDKNGDGLRNCDNFVPQKHLIHLYQHLRVNCFIDNIIDVKKENLHIISDNVLSMIKKQQEGWEDFLPKKVSRLIKANCMFGYCERPI